MPQRSVTRFFIPLIDVLTLLFCIYLLMPMVKTPEEAAAEAANPGEATRLAAAERRELERLRRNKEDLQDQVERLRQILREAPPQRLAVRLLQTGDKGQLYFIPKPGERVEITADNVQDFVREQRRETGEREPYFLMVTPRLGAEIPTYPLRRQLEEYDRWFENVAHSHIYYALPGK
jgi:hypothetical protein